MKRGYTSRRPLLLDAPACHHLANLTCILWVINLSLLTAASSHESGTSDLWRKHHYMKTGRGRIRETPRIPDLAITGKTCEHSHCTHCLGGWVGSEAFCRWPDDPFVTLRFPLEARRLQLGFSDWGPTSLLSNWYRGLFCGLKRSEGEAGYLSASGAKIKNVPYHRHRFSCRGD
jgi:hypothetical protein